MTLIWQFNKEYQCWETEVKAKNYLGEGIYKISLQQRPAYCDRGRWMLVVTSHGIGGLDAEEAMSRYYFSLERAKAEVEDWVNARSEIRVAYNE